jgi:hypothetical protein
MSATTYTRPRSALQTADEDSEQTIYYPNLGYLNNDFSKPAFQSRNAVSYAQPPTWASLRGDEDEFRYGSGFQPRGASCAETLKLNESDFNAGVLYPQDLNQGIYNSIPFRKDDFNAGVMYPQEIYPQDVNYAGFNAGVGYPQNLSQGPPQDVWIDTNDVTYFPSTDNFSASAFDPQELTQPMNPEQQGLRQRTRLGASAPPPRNTNAGNKTSQP